MTEIDLQIDCDAPAEKLDVLVMLLNQFLLEASIPNIEHLRRIDIVYDGAKDVLVNEIQGNKPGTYVGGDQSNACAFHVQKNTHLECYIIFGENFVQEIDPEHPYDAMIVLTLLEELYHVRLYSTRWEQKGYLYPLSDLSCTTDLMMRCSTFHDEYIVNRWKYAFFVAQAERNGTMKPFSASDFLLVAQLQQAEEKLGQIVYAATTGQIRIGTAWVSLLRCIYRDIFELLTRRAAPLAAIGSSHIEKHADLSESRYYQKKVASYWQRIQKELERSYTSDLAEADEALGIIVTTMREFIASLGVTYHKTAVLQCHLEDQGEGEHGSDS
jgi:hypothetical protein